MKNFFLIINKEKVCAYLVSIFTISILFLMSYVLNSDIHKYEEVSANLVQLDLINNDATDNIVKEEGENVIVPN